MYQFVKYENNLNVIGSNVRKYRLAANLSLAQVSDKLMLKGIDISKSSLQHIEVGKRVVRDYELYALCDLFGVTMEEMLSNFIKDYKKKN